VLAMWLNHLLPEGSVVTAIVPRTGGQVSTVFEVRRAGGDPLIVKRYAEQSRWKQAKEEHVYRLLAERGIGPVPRVVHADRERGATVLTLLPGTPMSEARMPEDSARSAYRRMGGFLADIHQIAMPAYGYLTTEVTDPLPDNTAYMQRQFARKLAQFMTLGGPVEVHDAVQERVAERAQLFAACESAVLCHNDLHEGNVLVDGLGAVTGFVDVENMISADPLIDLAKTLQYDLSASATNRIGLLEGYGPLPADGADRLQLYRLYHALELWDWFASIGHTSPLPRIIGDIASLASN
jgi:hygromycin-B 7''-O-kinase